MTTSREEIEQLLEGLRCNCEPEYVGSCYRCKIDDAIDRAFADHKFVANKNAEHYAANLADRDARIAVLSSNLDSTVALYGDAIARIAALEKEK